MRKKKATLTIKNSRPEWHLSSGLHPLLRVADSEWNSWTIASEYALNIVLRRR